MSNDKPEGIWIAENKNDIEAIRSMNVRLVAYTSRLAAQRACKDVADEIDFLHLPINYNML